jgi:hypothetical protein
MHHHGQYACTDDDPCYQRCISDTSARAMPTAARHAAQHPHDHAASSTQPQQPQRLQLRVLVRSRGQAAGLLGLEQQARAVTARRWPLCAMQAGAWLWHGPAAAVRHETCRFGAGVRSAAAKCYARCSHVSPSQAKLAYTGPSGWPRLTAPPPPYPPTEA